MGESVPLRHTRPLLCLPALWLLCMCGSVVARSFVQEDALLDFAMEDENDALGARRQAQIDDALPDSVMQDENDSLGARRQAQMAVGWGLYNSRRKANGQLESVSGPGSSMAFTQVARGFLQDIIERYSVRSIVDVACGDWHWMRHVDLTALGIEFYVGYDINGNIVADNTRLYGSDVVSFKHASLLAATLPPADLVIARDVLFHLSNAHIQTALANIRRSNSKLLLTTTYPWVLENKDLTPSTQPFLGFDKQPHLPVWGFREVNLDLAPFALADSTLALESAEESWGEDENDLTATRLLKLYSLSLPREPAGLCNPTDL